MGQYCLLRHRVVVGRAEVLDISRPRCDAHEAPDDAAAAGLLARVASTGAFTSVSTTKLLTVEEALDGFSRGAGLQYRAPGTPQ